ncbi:Leucine-rich repeat-containing protein 2 [Dissostichus eleginoides]|uniref:Leucine-rich repeat-containing protein 2 n=1 Tax=Dissostichus eleginoides TaxID=100907 RepID=A0AAD9BZ42_DISEL|nr:Leucine-rich repeat-containing protein 2 [Dissostichus eleginoides]
MTDIQVYTEAEQDQRDLEQSRLIFQLDGEQWMDFPRELQWMTYLKEWHVRGTRICRLPEYLALFTQLSVLQIPKNTIAELPPEIGKLTELGDCENLKRLELTGNHNLSELPFELSSLKQLLHLDIAENCFRSIPICALRMSALQLLDLSHNRLDDLPQDMDRLEQLVTLFVHKNNLTYLPHCLTKISTLKMIVVSGDELNSIPTRLCRNPEIKFIRLCDNRATAKKKKKEEEEKKKEKKKNRWREPREEEVKKDSGEKEFIELYIDSLKDRGERKDAFIIIR